MQQTAESSKDDLKISQAKLDGCDQLLTEIVEKEELNKEEILELTTRETKAAYEVEEAQRRLDNARALLKEAQNEETNIKSNMTDIKVLIFLCICAKPCEYGERGRERERERGYGGERGV